MFQTRKGFEATVLRVSVILYRAVGAGVAIALMEVLARFAGEPMSRVPFVTSIVLAMALPNSEPAQPRAILGGHIVSALSGWVAFALIGNGEAASAIAVGLGTLMMMVSRTLHPPAGIDAFLVVSYGLPAVWLINPVLIGALLLASFAVAWRWGERKLFPPPAIALGEPRTEPVEPIRDLTPPSQARP
jgi:CBS-domain-containing membrane protein